MAIRYFDDYEIRLLELIAQEQANAADSAKEAQKLSDSDRPALGAYVCHLSALERSSGLQKALLEYRSTKKHQGEQQQS